MLKGLFRLFLAKKAFDVIRGMMSRRRYSTAQRM